MENYDVVKRLGHGDQGTTFQVYHKESKTMFVMKMIECLDESHASLAFKEYIAIQEMGRHHLICALVDLFTHWDKQLSTVFVCVVETYVQGQNLGIYLDQRNASHSTIAESTIRKWLAQIVDALSFASHKRIPHRNLKPSNVYLDDVKNQIVLGGFCVPSIFSDMKTHPRSSIGSRHFLAPELTNKLTSDERADVWSVGCITLSMLLAGIRGVGSFVDRLERIKFSTTELENVLKLAEEFFTGDLLALTRSMLCLDPAVRPTLADLVNDRLIMEGSADANALRLKRQNTIHPYVPVPVGVPVMYYVRYITDHFSNEMCIVDVLKHMLMLIKSGETPMNLGSANQIVYRATAIHIAVEQAVVYGLQFLFEHLTQFPNDDDIMYTVDAMQFIFEAMKRYAQSADVQVAAVTLLSAIAFSERGTEVVRQLKGIKSILQTMLLFSLNSSISATCLNAIWRFAATAGKVNRIVGSEALHDVVKIMKIHKFESDVIQEAFVVIFALILPDENIRTIKELNFFDLVIEGVDEHRLIPKLVQNGFLALSALVQADEESAYRMVMRNPNDVYHPLQKIMEIYHYQSNDLDVSHSLCTLLYELSQYEDIASEMQYLDVEGKILKDLQQNFKDAQIFNQCNRIITNMRNVKPILPIPVQPL